MFQRVSNSDVRGATLTLGTSKGCGCQRGRSNTTHGKSRTPTHKIWMGMIKRCRNPKASRYSWYGGRGIKVCERWNSFENFLADMGERPSTRHSLDRIDSNGNYEPNNTRWVVQIVQANNRSNNHKIQAAGKTQTIAQWAKELGIPQTTISARLRRKWTNEQSLGLTPN